MAKHQRNDSGGNNGVAKANNENRKTMAKIWHRRNGVGNMSGEIFVTKMKSGEICRNK